MPFYVCAFVGYVGRMYLQAVLNMLKMGTFPGTGHWKSGPSEKTGISGHPILHEVQYVGFSKVLTSIFPITTTFLASKSFLIRPVHFYVSLSLKHTQPFSSGSHLNLLPTSAFEASLTKRQMFMTYQHKHTSVCSLFLFFAPSCTHNFPFSLYLKHQTHTTPSRHKHTVVMSEALPSDATRLSEVRDVQSTNRRNQTRKQLPGAAVRALQILLCFMLWWASCENTRMKLQILWGFWCI